jgi:hypothetical protein
MHWWLVQELDNYLWDRMGRGGGVKHAYFMSLRGRRFEFLRQINRRMDGWTDGRTDGWTYRQRKETDRQTDNWTDRRTDWSTDGQAGRH